MLLLIREGEKAVAASVQSVCIEDHRGMGDASVSSVALSIL